MVTKKDPSSTKEKEQEPNLDEVRSELNAIQRHFRKLLHLGGKAMKMGACSCKEKCCPHCRAPLEAIKKQIQEKPVVSALGVLAAGIIIGRLFKSCRKKR